MTSNHPMQVPLAHDGAIRCFLEFTFVLFHIAVPVLAQSASAPVLSKPSVALVTFVNNGTTLTGGLPGQQSQGFRGKLFVEDILLANMRPARFITFAFEPVTVTFTAQTWIASGPKGGAHLTLDLVAGKHYFVEVRTKQSWPLAKMFGIKEVSCKEAAADHARDQPLPVPERKSSSDPEPLQEVAFPSCS